MDNDIGLGRQSLENLLALRGLQVDGEVLRARLRAVAAQAVEVAPHGVALQGLHVYHPHAKLVGEGARERAGYDGGEIQQGDALQRVSGQRRRRRCAVPVGYRRALQPAQHFLGVLTKVWRGALNRAGGVAHPDQYAQLLHLAHPGIVHLYHVPVVHHLGVIHPLLCGVEGLGGHVGGLVDEDVHPLVFGLLQAALDYHGPQLLALFGHQGRGLLEARVLEDVAQAHALDSGAEQPDNYVGHLYPFPVLGADGLIAHAGLPVGVRLGVVLEPVREVDHHLPYQPVADVESGDSLHEAGLDLLAHARLVADYEGRQDASKGSHCRAVTCYVDRGVVGAGAPRLSGEDRVSSHLGGDDALVGFVVGVRPLGTECGYGAVDQVGSIGAQGIVANAKGVRLAGGAALDNNVSLGGELLGFRPSLLRLQVQNNALLSTVPEEVLGELPVRVSGRRLDLDYLRSKIRQHHCGDGARPAGRKVYDNSVFHYLRHTFTSQ